jgi:tripartite-type tricarboxylate transporter receptor subunit TctC
LSTTAGVSREIVAKINEEVRKIIAEPAIQEQFVKRQLYEPMTSSPEEFSAFIRVETERWGGIIRDQHLQIAH